MFARAMTNRTFTFIAAAVLLLLVPRFAAAQTDVARAVTEVNPPATEKPNADVGHKLEVLEEQLRAQSEKLDKLMAVVAEQQRIITELRTHNTANLASATTASTSATTDVAAGAPASATAASTETQPPTVEDRLKKIEESAKRIGPFRVSGDFRLRFDGLFRRADPNPPPGFTALTHQQNVRARYRLRINFDTQMYPNLAFHAQLATGLFTGPTGSDEDFAQTIVRHPITISEAWLDWRPYKPLQLQVGRVQEIFNDGSRFLFDDDAKFNGFNEKYTLTLNRNSLDVASIEFRAGQYILGNPNVAIVTPGSPLALAGAKIGSTGRSSTMFHQGVLVNQKYNDRWTSQWGGDIQLFRNPNQIQLASTAAGVVLIVQNGIGITLSGPIGSTGNATTTPGGAIYTAPSFKIARLTWRLNWAGFKSGNHEYPVLFNIQGSRNVGIGLPERDAWLAAVQVGRTTKGGDMAFYYTFAQKGANALISQFTDDDLGTNSGVNIRTHHLRFDLAFSKRVVWQSLLYIQNELRNSGDFPNFFVPLNAFTPRQYRLQEQFVFTF